MPAVLVPSTADRAPLLERCLASIHARYPSWPVYVVLQGRSDTPEAPFTDLLRLPDRVGPHGARMAGLARWSSDVWVMADDDFVIGPGTDWSTPAEFVAARPDVGLISCNWRRTPAMAERVVLQDRYVAQVLVFTGGGMVLTAETAADVRMGVTSSRPVTDNVEWSLASYLAGRLNGRYLGSVASASVSAAGGRKGWLSATACTPPDPRLLDWTLTPSTFYEHRVNDLKMPTDRDVTAIARRLHAEARAVLYPDAPRRLAA